MLDEKVRSTKLRTALLRPKSPISLVQTSIADTTAVLFCEVGCRGGCGGSNKRRCYRDKLPSVPCGSSLPAVALYLFKLGNICADVKILMDPRVCPTPRINRRQSGHYIMLGCGEP